MESFETDISTAFPYESRFAKVEGSIMHYVEEGSGDPILFLHGNPTSSYLWRNVIPEVKGMGRAIAPDLIGMGKSEKPRIPYRIFDHVEYIDGFIEALGLENITLVLHDWGSFIGFHYLARNPRNVRALAFMEAIVRPMRWEDRSPQFQQMFRAFRTEGVGWQMICRDNFFVEQVLPGAVIRKLGEEEMARYREPFPDEESRRPLWQFPNDIPIEGEPADVCRAVEEYGRALEKADIPMLLLTFEPGAIMGKKEIEWCRASLRKLKTVHVGPGIHFVQEDHPARIGREIRIWLEEVAIP